LLFLSASFFFHGRLGRGTFELTPLATEDIPLDIDLPAPLAALAALTPLNDDLEGSD
jgi:hypothetical protein